MSIAQDAARTRWEDLPPRARGRITRLLEGVAQGLVPMPGGRMATSEEARSARKAVEVLKKRRK